MTKSITQKLQQLKQDDEIAFQELIQCFRTQSSTKGDILVRQGDVGKNLIIIKEGVVRHFRHDDEGKEYNIRFSFEDQIVLSIGSYMNQIPSNETVELLEDTTYDCISSDHLIPLLNVHHSLEKIFREMLLMYYIELEDRLHRIQSYSAEKKYNYLVGEQPHILERISQNHIASYLGISRETLSRIRDKSRKS